MIHAAICQLSGSLLLDKKVIGRELDYDNFKDQFGSGFDLIFGNNGNAKYSLRETIDLFENEFRVYVYFTHGKLRCYVLCLISGPVTNRVEEYPDADMLKFELNYIDEIFKRNLSGKLAIEYEWRHSWRYEWGEITLMEQVQDSSVITNIEWYTGV